MVTISPRIRTQPSASKPGTQRKSEVRRRIAIAHSRRSQGAVTRTDFGSFVHVAHEVPFAEHDTSYTSRPRRAFCEPVTSG